MLVSPPPVLFLPLSLSSSLPLSLSPSPLSPSLQDYGNSETRNNAASNSPGQMEAINWGNGFGGAFHPGKPDASDPDNVPGPHVMADLENGVWAGDNAAVNPTNTDVHARFVTAMLKGGPAGRDRADLALLTLSKCRYK